MDEASIYRAFGKAVATRRRLLRKTQAEVARLVGLSRGSLANIELGNQKVFLHQVLAFAHALQLESAHEIVPERAIGPIERSSRRARVTGTKRLTPQQRKEVEALVDALTPHNREATDDAC